MRAAQAHQLLEERQGLRRDAQCCRIRGQHMPQLFIHAGQGVGPQVLLLYGPDGGHLGYFGARFGLWAAEKQIIQVICIAFGGKDGSPAQLLFI